MSQAEQIRHLAAKENAGRGKYGRRYSAELKAMAVAFSLEGIAEGRSVRELAESLGIFPQTLRSWLAAPPQPPTFREVEVAEIGPSTPLVAPSLTVHTADGLRIEGLSFSQVMELLERRSAR